MSAEDVEIVRQAYEDFDRGDPDLELLLRHYAPDHVLVTEWGAGDSKTYRGPEGVRRALEENAELFDDFGNEVEEVVDVGGGRVVATIRATGRGRASGAMVDQRVGVLARVADGLIVHTQYYLTSEEALAAARLEG